MNNEYLIESNETNTHEDYVVGETIYYSTGEVAKMLNTTRDKLRYHIRDFEEYLSSEKTSQGKGGHLRIASKDIELIRSIIRLKDSGKSVEHIKEMLDDPGINLLLGEGTKVSKSMIDILSKNNEFLIQKISELIDGKLLLENKQQALLLESSKENQKELEFQNKLLSEQVSQMQTDIIELKELLNKRLPEKKRLSFLKRK